MAEKSRKRIGEILIEDGLLEPSQLEAALAYQKENGGLIGQVLIDMKLVDEASLVGALGEQFRIPYIPLKNYSINPDMATWLKAEFCHENLLVAFDGDAKRVWIALSDPLNEDAVAKIRAMTQRIPMIFISRNSEIRDALYSLYHEGK